LLTDDIVRFVAQSEKFVPHFHIPLQSGCNDVLARMKRRYNREQYAERLFFIKKMMPNACLGADVMVGFPQETEAEFTETHEFLRSVPLSYLHVFTFSARANTPAYEMQQVPQPIKKERNLQLRILSDKLRQAFYQEHLGKTAKVLWEAENRHGEMYGYTEHYIRTKTEWNEELCNRLLPFSLEKISEDGFVLGSVLAEQEMV
jgi:threonylcarbamoyladenosine tRNA methylthiotransferase MtaB